MEQNKDVKSGESSATVSPEVDEKGVPFQNRVREAARKMTDEYESKLNSAMQRISELEEKSAPKEQYGPESPSERQARIQDFVNDPDGYIENRILTREFKREMPEAVSWLESQNGYQKSVDEQRIAKIIKENELNAYSPKVRAQAAWKILKSEKLEKELADLKAEKARQTNLSESNPDGAGKSTSVKTKSTRTDLLKKLAEAEKRNDTRASSEIWNEIEGVTRE